MRRKNRPHRVAVQDLVANKGTGDGADRRRVRFDTPRGFGERGLEIGLDSVREVGVEAGVRGGNRGASDEGLGACVRPE